jgi:membrane fusion protein (multidrug efflux system)
LELAQAGVALAEAGVAAARLDLEWTRVGAPIAGITGLKALSEGSLVSPGTLLTTITQTDPIHIRFALPEGDAALQRAARQAMSEAKEKGRAGDDNGHRRTAILRLPDGGEYPHPGEVDFTDTSIDPRTGSITARAVFANPEGRIMPGQFVRLTMVTRHFEEIMALPEEAIAQGRNGSQVFVVEEGNKVGVRPVELGAVKDGRQIVLSGISDEDRVIVRGLNNLREGMPVQPRPVNGGQ